MSNITLVLTPEEQNALMQILDASLKHLGINGAVAVSHFLARIELAKKTEVSNDPAPSE